MQKGFQGFGFAALPVAHPGFKPFATLTLAAAATPPNPTPNHMPRLDCPSVSAETLRAEPRRRLRTAKTQSLKVPEPSTLNPEPKHPEALTRQNSIL